MQCRRGGYPSPERRNMICPKCNRDFPRLLALSRTDNETMICDECGTKEALDAVGFTGGKIMMSTGYKVFATVQVVNGEIVIDLGDTTHYMTLTTKSGITCIVERKSQEFFDVETIK